MHQLQLLKTWPTDAGLWHCPECGRLMIVQQHPFKRIVLIEGDEYPGHQGQKGGLVLDGSAEQMPEDLRNELSELLDGLEWD